MPRGHTPAPTPSASAEHHHTVTTGADRGPARACHRVPCRPTLRNSVACMAAGPHTSSCIPDWLELGRQDHGRGVPSVLGWRRGAGRPGGHGGDRRRQCRADSLIMSSSISGSVAAGRIQSRLGREELMTDVTLDLCQRVVRLSLPAEQTNQRIYSQIPRRSRGCDAFGWENCNLVIEPPI